MKFEISSRKENPVMKREEIEVFLDHSGAATPKREALLSELAKSLGVSHETIIVDKIFHLKGRAASKAKVFVYKDKKEVPLYQKEKMELRMKPKKAGETEAKPEKSPKAEKPAKAEKHEKPHHEKPKEHEVKEKTEEHKTEKTTEKGAGHKEKAEKSEDKEAKE